MQNSNYYYPNKIINIMNIPFTVKLAVDRMDPVLDEIFTITTDQIENRLKTIDETFSTFKDSSMVRKFQDGDMSVLLNSIDFQSIYSQSEIAKEVTEGYFDSYYSGKYDPTGIVKGWVIETCFDKYLVPLLDDPNIVGVSLNGGGDVKMATDSKSTFEWGIGIEDPNNLDSILMSFTGKNFALATSGISKRGDHITQKKESSITQVTVFGDSLVVSDVWATAGISAGTDQFKKLIAKNQLSAVVVDSKEGILKFEKGEESVVKQASI